MHPVSAFASPARRATLVTAGTIPIIQISTVDEDAVLTALPGERTLSGRMTIPAGEAATFAATKCADVRRVLSMPNTNAKLPENETVLVVGCDSMLEIDGQMLGKPHTPDVTRERTYAMRHMSATLWADHSVAILTPASSDDSWGHERAITTIVTHSISTQVHFGNISDAEIDTHVVTGEPLYVAGFFMVDGLDDPSIEGAVGDYHSVVGIPLPLSRFIATELGVS